MSLNETKFTDFNLDDFNFLKVNFEDNLLSHCVELLMLETKQRLVGLVGKDMMELDKKRKEELTHKIDFIFD